MYTEDELARIISDRFPDFAPDVQATLTSAIVDFARECAALERKTCADMVRDITLSDILLAAGEMTPQERLTALAVKRMIEAKIRGSGAAPRK